MHCQMHVTSMEAADRLCGKQDGYALLVNSNTILSNTELHTEKKYYLLMFITCHGINIIQGSLIMILQTFL